MSAAGSSLDPLRIRSRLGRDRWWVSRPFGPVGWMFDSADGRIIVSVAPEDGVEWVHASISHPDRMPTYDELRHMHFAVLEPRWAWEIHAPQSAYINIHPFARHLWARLDGRNVLPDFGRGGSI